MARRRYTRKGKPKREQPWIPTWARGGPVRTRTAGGVRVRAVTWVTRAGALVTGRVRAPRRLVEVRGYVRRPPRRKGR